MRREHSRGLRLAAEVSDQSEPALEEALTQARVALGVDNDPDCIATALLLVDTLRRLPLRLELEAKDLPAGVAESLFQRATAVDPSLGLRLAEEPGALRVHVGRARDDAAVRGIPARHGAHLARGERELPRGATASGLGLMTCAALLAAEVFKRVAQVRVERKTETDRLSWCPVTLTDEPEACPTLPESDVDLALVGLGAVGTASARILSLMPLEGSMLLVDPERFGPENVGTYSIGTSEDGESQPWKTDLAARVLNRFDVSQFRQPVERLVETIDREEARWPRVVLAGLDSATARREVQRLWPDRLIDGGTGDTMCGLHDVEAGRGACLMCLFPRRTEGPSATERLAAVTGLPPELLRYGDQPLTSEHLSLLSGEMRDHLQSHVGKPVCGLAEALGLSELPADDYRPAVPFVSQLAACLVVGRFVACELGIADLPRLVQFDALFGPESATRGSPLPEPECFCQERSAVVTAVRKARRETKDKLLAANTGVME